MTVSLAMIVKDEEMALARCLESVRSAADDLVVVDTGSSDGTREVAERYGARLFDFVWRHDFGAARQFAFDRAIGDWVFWVDADDVVVNAAAIKTLASTAPAAMRGYYWRYVYARDGFGQPTCEFWRERLVRHDGTFRWRGRVHEVLVGPADAQLARAGDVVVVHEPEAARPKNPYRNLEILIDEYEHTREHPDPRLLVYLGFEYAGLQEVDLAIGFLRKFIARSAWIEQNYFAHLRIAALLRQRGRYIEAIDEARAAARLLAGWPHAYFSIAETYYFLNDWPSVVAWVDRGRGLPLPDPLCPHDPLDARFRWMIHFTNALYRVGRTDEALAWTDAALSICPQDRWHLHNRTFFANEQGKRSAALATAATGV